MEWLVPVNEMLNDKITKLNYTLIPPGFHGDVRGVRVMQESLSKVIDMLGEQSATAQGLNRVITTTEKLRNSPTHILYLLKDAKAKGGKGDVIGLLKVGRKHLFLFDEKDKVCEVEPLCVLDFFVLRDRQRHGYGKLLFNHMLQDMEVSAQELAIDGPSPKMEQFLKKNYDVERLMRQNNNFAVSPQFFGAVPEMSTSVGASPEAEIEGEADRHAGKEAEPVAEVEESEAEIIEKAEKQKSPERPSTLHVEPVSEAPPSAPALSPAGSMTSRRDSQLTDRGYFDVKFYHNKLW